LAARVAIAALEVLKEENLAGNAERLGKILFSELKNISHSMIKTVRGKGLFAAMVINPFKEKNAWDLCVALKDNGLLAKPTHCDIIRFAPPLIITEEQLTDCLNIIRRTIKEF
jgi:ornithine--oxo-acid transaminase